MLNRWWQRYKFLAPIRKRPDNIFYSTTLLYPELAPKLGQPKTKLKPYEGLAPLYNDYTKGYASGYLASLQSIKQNRSSPIDSVLDLACGAGRLTESLAEVSSEVVGLDISEPMLMEARARSTNSRVRYINGDFRDFDLNMQFDAVVCTLNSLNYVPNINGLSDVMQCVAKHLRPGGIFVFDILTSYGLRTLSGYYLHAPMSQPRFAIYFLCDEEERTEKSYVLLPSGLEEHTRIAIDVQDVRDAVKGTGLIVEDYFTAVCFGRWRAGPICFFILSRSG